MGTGASTGRSLAVTQPGILPLETLREGLLSLAGKYQPDNGATAFAIQLNNLDLNKTFSAEQLKRFLNEIRDSLQLPGFSWLLVGDMGLSH